MKSNKVMLTINEIVEMVECRQTNPKRSEALMKRGLATGQLIIDKQSELCVVNVDFTTGEVTYIPMEEIMKSSKKLTEVTNVVERTSAEKREAGDMAIDLNAKPDVRVRGMEQVDEAFEVVNKAMETNELTLAQHAENLLKSGGTYTPTMLENKIFAGQEALMNIVKATVWSTLVMEDGSEVRRVNNPNVVSFTSKAYSKGWLPLSTDGLMTTDCDYLVCVEIKPETVMSAKYGWNYIVLKASSTYTNRRGKTVTIPTRQGTGQWADRSFIDFAEMDSAHLVAVHRGFTYLSDAKDFMSDVASKLSVLYNFSREAERTEETAEEREARAYDEQEKQLAKAGKPPIADI